MNNFWNAVVGTLKFIYSSPETKWYMGIFFAFAAYAMYFDRVLKK
jgi:hypothetical protein